MSYIIISDDRKEMHYLVKVTSGEDIKFPRKGSINIHLTGEVLGYSKSYSDAVGKTARARAKEKNI